MSNGPEFEALFKAALDAVLVVDDGRIFVDANPAACHLLGRPVDELLGLRLDDVLTPPPPDLDAAWQGFLTTGQQSGELRVVCAGGALRDVEYSARAHFVPGHHLAMLRDITDRKHAEVERADLLRREQLRLQETATLLAISRTLSSTLDPTETMRRVAREIARALNVDMVGAYLADPAQENLHPVAGYRVPKDLLDAFRRFPIPIKNHPAIEEAWFHRRAVWTDDLPADPRVDAGTYHRFPHQSDLFMPICVKDRPVGGFFLIWWSTRRSFSEDELRLLQGISDLAGIFLENARLYRETAAANQAKDEFLATLSHELRNPLGAISNAVSALQRSGLQEESAVRLRQIVQRQTRHLARLLEDLLDVAGLTAGKISIRPQPLMLGDVAGHCVRSLRDAGKGREHRITLRAEPVAVNADPTRLEQVVTNLLENAVKYTPVGGSIDVDVLREGHDAVLCVTDTGIGIAPDLLARVFDLFAQGDRPVDRSPGGLGIGLNLARRLIEMHGGTVRAQSEGHGRGARFTIRLPLALTQRPAPPSPAAMSDQPRRVLIIEDDDDARESLHLLLESLGHRVIETGDGTQGVALALAERPDVVLIDLGLAGLDGYGVARMLRATAVGKTASLIAVTGYGQTDDRERSKEAGFDAHLVKPVSASALASLIAAVR